MRIIVMSDTHGNYRALQSIITRNADADWFIHLGDGERDLDRFILANPEFTEKVIHVKGNCDENSLSPDFFVLPLPFGHRIFAAHGHRYFVRDSLLRIKQAAIDNECDIVLYGHTHVRYNKYEDGLYIMNPGSASAPYDSTKPSFGHIDISEAGVVTNIADV
ncbi:metallophosphoesterase [Ruminococcus sp. XPD3002]|uniref:metallophosphoesterase family protein n=1 Tax=Ruminococcus sp. XPD3002 TaxID=1452269 RepID=UPI0009135038|nr:YfcE family phosphodiesterase [Ruminococcus sp.]SFX30735.1 hypothetical protein SAMN04487832_10429 [Ruminococcus flavefaciens]HPY85977.1 YfcE family phosphodiesterase [Ruminococcus flavefaciens]HRU97355.1 YfcE family phosphodiesterase [Ruminococcus sp.]